MNEPLTVTADPDAEQNEPWPMCHYIAEYIAPDNTVYSSCVNTTGGMSRNDATDHAATAMARVALRRALEATGIRVKAEDINVRRVDNLMTTARDDDDE